MHWQYEKIKTRMRQKKADFLNFYDMSPNVLLVVTVIHMSSDTYHSSLITFRYCLDNFGYVKSLTCLLSVQNYDDVIYSDIKAA